MLKRPPRHPAKSPRPVKVVVSPLWKRRPMYCATWAALVAAFLWNLGTRGEGDDQDSYHDRVFWVVGVADDATLQITAIDGSTESTTVRLNGVAVAQDAAQQATEASETEAAAFLREHLLGRNVRLLLDPSFSRDSRGFLTAYAVIDETGESVNEMLIEAGVGRADLRRDHAMKGRYQMLQRLARRGVSSASPRSVSSTP